jgi:hypothetical protein
MAPSSVLGGVRGYIGLRHGWVVKVGASGSNRLKPLPLRIDHGLNSDSLLTSFFRCLIFHYPRPEGLGIGCRRVSGAPISMLLQGGCGHEKPRLFSPLPLHHWLRPAV